MEQAEVIAVVLAAGASSRLGHPKALLDLGGQTALELVAQRIENAGVSRGVVVIAEPHADAIRAGADPRPLSWTLNEEPSAGRLGSIQCGMRAAPGHTDVLLWPVDRPLASQRLVTELLVARGGSGEPFVVSPVCGGHRGHPLVLAAALRRRMLHAGPDVSLRDLLAAPDIRRIDVSAKNEPEIHENLDTEESYRRVLRRLPSSGDESS